MTPPAITPALPPTLTGDELRAVARLVGARLPVLLLGYDGDDEPSVDAVAARSLIARGALVWTTGAEGPRLALTEPARQGLAPLLTPDALLEIDHEGETSVRVVAAVQGERMLRLAEVVSDVWVLTPDGDAEAVLAEITATLGRASTSADRLPEPVTVRITGAAHAHVETLLAGGDDHLVAAALATAGVPVDDAATLARALASRTGDGAVRRAWRQSDGGHGLAATTWFTTPDEVWMVTPADDPDGGDDLGDLTIPADPWPGTVSTFVRTTPAAVATALARTLGASTTGGRSR